MAAAVGRMSTVASRAIVHGVSLSLYCIEVWWAIGLPQRQSGRGRKALQGLALCFESLDSVRNGHFLAFTRHLREGLVGQPGSSGFIFERANINI